jgi:lipopolysaccharide export system protein LptA
MTLATLSLLAFAENAPVPSATPPSVVLTNTPAVTATDSAGKTNKTEITSKQLRMDTDKKIAYFDGEVLVNDPQFQLRSNRLIVYLNQNSSGMEHAEAYEDVVIVQESQKRKAYSQKAIYYSADGRMVLTGNPQIQGERGVTRGDVITIYRNTNQVLVEGNTTTTIDLGTSAPTNAPPADAASTNAPPSNSSATNSAPPQTAK